MKISSKLITSLAFLALASCSTPANSSLKPQSYSSESIDVKTSMPESQTSSAESSSKTSERQDEDVSEETSEIEQEESSSKETTPTVKDEAIFTIKMITGDDGLLEAHISADKPARLTSIVFNSNKTVYIGENESFDRATRIYIEDNINDISTIDSGRMCKEIYISNEVEKLSGPCFRDIGTDANDNSAGGYSQLDIYFEGDCPEMTDSTFDSSNQSYHCYYNKGANGFDDMIMNGAIFLPNDIDDPVIPDDDLHDYSRKATNRAREIARNIFDETEETDTKELYLVPNMNPCIWSDVRNTVDEITKDCINNSEKAEAIFSWIHSNITYDYDYLFEDATKCFQDKKAVCNGYVIIMKDMLSTLGIQSCYIGGTTRMFDWDVESYIRDHQEEYLNRGCGHAILAYEIDDKVMISDPTNNIYDMSDEIISNYFTPDTIEGITPIPEDYDIRSYGSAITEMADSKNAGLYLTSLGGIIGGNQTSSFINDGTYSFTFFLNDHASDWYNEEKPLYSVLKNEAIKCDWLPIEYYSVGSGHALSITSIVRYFSAFEDEEWIDRSKYDFLNDYIFVGGSAYENDGDELKLLAGNGSGNVVIPDSINGKTVTSIEDYAFQWNNSLTGIDTGNGVREIGIYAFDKCDNLIDLHLGDNVEKIGFGAFYKCSSIKEVTLDDNLKEASNAFSYMMGVETVNVGKSEVDFSGRPFDNCDNISRFTVDEDNAKYKTIDDSLYSKNGDTIYAYAIAKPNTDYTSPEGLHNIEKYAFYFANNLKTMTLNSGIDDVGQGALSSNSLESIVIDQDSSISLGNQVFIWDENLTNLSVNCQIDRVGDTILENTAYINDEDNYVDGLLYINNALITSDWERETYSIREGTTVIAGGVFYGHKNLKKIALPDGITDIPWCSFYGCSNLEKIYIPGTLETIECQAFDGCSSLEDVYYSGTEDNFVMLKIMNGASYNYNLYDSTIHYVSSVPADF